MDKAHKADLADIIIRSAEPEDAEQVAALLGQPGVFEGLLQTPDASHATRLEFLRKIEPASCKLVALVGERVVAHAGLFQPQTSLRRAHVRGLGIGIAPQYQGIGLGKKLIGRMLDWADNWAGVLRVELTVHADNSPAIALYRAMGFVEEGRHAGYSLRGGEFIDALCMARLHPQPPQFRTVRG